MKISKALLGVCAALPLCVNAQADIKTTTPEGFLSRGLLMYGDKNYVGAIDQLKHLHEMPASASMIEQADFYIALSRYERGEKKSIDEIMRFINKYPTSHLVPQAWAKIGDFYFFNGKYGEAIRAYENVRVSALDGDSDLDMTYREGYSMLRLGEFDSAKTRFDRLSYTSRYHDAGTFFHGYIDYANKNYDGALEKFRSIDTNGELSNAAEYYICQIMFAKKQYPEVITKGRKLMLDNRCGEFSSELQRLIGESLYHEGNDAEAAKYINSYMESCESEPERTSQYILGVIDFRNRGYGDCIEHLGGVTGEDDALAQSAYLYIGQSYIKTGNLNSAAMAFEKAFNMPFDQNVQETAFYNYALTQNGGGRTPFNRSIDIFEQFLNKYPKSKYASDVEDYLINAYINGNDYQRALTSISHIKSPSSKVLNAKQSVLYHLGVQSLSNEQTSTALKYFNQAYSLGNYDSALRNECLLWIGECQYRSGKYAAAEKNQSAFIAAAGTSNKNYGIAQYDLGYSRFQQRNYSSARSSFEKAATASKLSEELRADAYNRIGDTYYYAKQYTAAASAYDNAHKLSKTAGEYALFQKAMMQGLAKNHSAKISQLDELLREYPNSSMAPTAMLQKGEAYVAMNNSKAAINTYDELLRRYPNSADARKGLLQMAITERNAGNEAGAINSYKKVISNYPTSEEASVAAEDLKLIYADNGNLQQYASFLNTVTNGPKLDVSEIDRLTFEAAEKAYMAEKSSITKMKNYVSKYPNGAYISKAQYYIARYEYKKGNYTEALAEINKVLARTTDSSFAEDALAMKGDILLRQKKAKEALATYEQLLPRASSHDNKLNANLGIMRTSLELERYANVESSANSLLALGGLSADEEKEATFNRAYARLKLNKGSEARKDLSSLAENTQSVYGAKAAYELANYYYNAGNLKDAEKVLNDFIDNGTPHQYWLARGFILLADVYHKRGDNFEACEYLESLKNNYPGKDNDIFKMIDSRLNSWKTSNKSKSKKK